MNARRGTSSVSSTGANVVALFIAWAAIALARGQAPLDFATDGVPGPEEAKATFLYYFGTYVDWPTDAAEAVTIALFRADGLAPYLRNFVADRLIDERPVNVRTVSSISEISDGQILFIGASANAELDQILAALAGRPILVVTDVTDGLHAGAVINFRLIDGRVRFEVSLGSARDANVGLSSRLLAAALNVEGQ